MFDRIKDKIDDMVWDWKVADNKERALKVAKGVANVAMMTTAVGQTAKTAKTAAKLATCGYCHSAKAVASLTLHAQKTNAIKAATNIAKAGAVKAAASVMDNTTNNTNYNNENVNYSDPYAYIEPSKEDLCKDKVRTMLLLGRWNMRDAVDYVKRELYSNFDDVFAETIAYQFVLDVRKANNIK